MGRKKITADEHEINAAIGARIRLRRRVLSISQERLSEAIGVTYQQVQKYESGANRIGASHLLNLSRALDVPVSFFFDIGQGEEPSISDVNLLGRDILDLSRAFERIKSEKHRKAVISLARSLGDEP